MPVFCSVFPAASVLRRAALLSALIAAVGCQNDTPPPQTPPLQPGRPVEIAAGRTRLSPRGSGPVLASAIPGPIGLRGPRGWPVGVREDAPADFEVYLSPADGVDLQIAGRLGLLLGDSVSAMRVYWVAPPDTMARATSMARQLRCLSREAFAMGEVALIQRLLGASPSRWPALQQAIAADPAGPRLLAICDNDDDRSLDQTVDNRTRLLTLVGPSAIGKSVLLDRRGPQTTGWWIGQGATTLPDSLWQTLPRLRRAPSAAVPDAALPTPPRP